MENDISDDEARAWDVFDSDRGLTIQRIDDCEAPLEDDIEAVRMAIGDANVGDDYALKAIECCCTQDYKAWEKFLKRRALAR